VEFEGRADDAVLNIVRKKKKKLPQKKFLVTKTLGSGLDPDRYSA
jgi:hypothetical protein